MKRYAPVIFPSILVLTILLSGCGNVVTLPPPPTDTATSLPTLTMTPDPCAPGNIETEVNNVHRHMREFDDASLLAANMPRDKVGDAIPNLQRIRREAEDQPIPSCLANLKTYQIAHMNSVINTLIAFMNGSDQEAINQGISIARQQHDQYTLELARVLGLTVVTATAPAASPTAEVTLQSPTPTP